MKSYMQVLFLCTICHAIGAKSLDRIELSDRFTHKIKKILERSIRQTENKDLDEEDNLEAYLLMIGSLTLLSKRGKLKERPSYYKMLGLTFFNFPSSYRDPFFAESLRILKKAADITKIQPPSVLLVLLLVVGLFFILLGMLENIIVSVIGLLYPAYMSFKAIESKSSEDDQ